MSFRFVAFAWWTSTLLLALPGFGAGTVRGSIKDSSGAALNGVFVSAQRAGATFTTTVYSDDTGQFRFPPLAAGSYTVTAHAGGFQPARRANVAVQDGATLPMDFALQVETRPEVLLQQARASEWLASLPGTVEQKMSLGKNCGSCHHNLYHLQGVRFTKEDWVKVISAMERIDVIGEIREPRPAYYMPWRHGTKEQIAEYLAQVQGPDSPLANIRFFPRASGKATQAVITEYRVPRANAVPHDVQLDSQGNAWYNDFKTDHLGKINPATGEIKEYKLPSKPGFHPGSSNMFVGDDDTIWVNQRIAGTLTRFDPKTEQVVGRWERVGGFDRFDSKSGIAYGTNGQLDVKTGKVLRYQYKADTDGYGTAVDSRGFAYRGGIADSDIKVLNPETGEVANILTPTPDSGPRRIQLDGDAYLWFGEWFGGKIGRLDIKAGTITEHSVSVPFAAFYEAGTDPKNHHGWAFDWRSDRLMRVDPATGAVTEYPMPTRDVESRRTAVDTSTNPPSVWIHGAGNGLIIRVQAPI
ncbi:MAG: carboxypeptidase regulatory-like domain-containing protein [Terriglobia bacterium]